jgi:hypothetical protein
MAAILIRVMANQPQPGVLSFKKPSSIENTGTPNPNMKSIRIGINMEHLLMAIVFRKLCEALNPKPSHA